MIQKDLPLIDLHRHLDGAVRLETILELARNHNIPLPAWDKEGLRPHVQVVDPQPGIMAFLTKFKWMTAILVDYDACRRIGYENVQDAHNEGIDYIELRFSPWFMAEAHHLDPQGITEAVIDGVRSAARDTGVKANVIGIISRTFGTEIGWKELNALIECRKEIVALDLAGDEQNFPGDLFVPHFRKARDMGWRITVHAGEAGGAENIWQAIQELGAERIGHAIKAIDDPRLMDYLKEHRIGVESNITSNVQTSCVASYRAHPIRKFLESGIRATINTDDPGISGITLPHEYEIATTEVGLSAHQIRQAQSNALSIAFLPEDEKRELLKRKAKKVVAE
jgi:adenosine deaminase